jgi:hypothetical protein
VAAGVRLLYGLDDDDETRNGNIRVSATSPNNDANNNNNNNVAVAASVFSLANRTLSFSGSLDAIQSVMLTLAYQSDINFAGNDTVVVTVSDQVGFAECNTQNVFFCFFFLSLLLSYAHSLRVTITLSLLSQGASGHGGGDGRVRGGVDGGGGGFGGALFSSALTTTAAVVVVIAEVFDSLILRVSPSPATVLEDETVIVRITLLM